LNHGGAPGSRACPLAKVESSHGNREESMAQFGSATCDFDVDEAQDGKHWMIAVKPRADIGLPVPGHLTFELKPDFEYGDAKVLTRMLKDWITQIHFEAAE
jgi:hypothetical protein